MVGQLLINGLDAWLTYGVVLEAGSNEALLLPAPVKELPKNNQSGQHGSQVYIKTVYGTPVNVKVNERDVTLTFCFVWKTNYMTRYAAFVNMLQLGKVELKVTELALGFNLVYESSKSYESLKYAGKIQVQFTEPNPKNRITL